MPFINRVPSTTFTITPNFPATTNAPSRRYVAEVAVTHTSGQASVALGTLPAGHTIVSSEIVVASAGVHGASDGQVCVGNATTIYCGGGHVLTSTGTTTLAKNARGFSGPRNATTANASSNKAAVAYSLYAVTSNGTTASTFGAAATYYVRIVFDVIGQLADAT